MKPNIVFAASVALTLPLAAATVHLEASDTGDETSFNSATHWSPSPASAEGASCDYVVSGGLTLRTPFQRTNVDGELLTFGGKSLSIGEPDFSSGGKLGCRHYRDRAEFPDLRLYKGSAYSGIPDSYEFFEGVATVYSPVSDPFDFSLSANREFIYSWNFVGGDTACIKLSGDGTHHFYYTQSGTTTVYENPDYHGSWVFDVSGRINFGNAASLGGAKTTFAADGIVMSGGGTNTFSASSVTIAASSNRGITLSGRGATLNVPNGKTLRIDVPITSADGAKLVKIGAGTLILGGSLDADLDVRAGMFVPAEGFSKTARANVVVRMTASDTGDETSFNSATHWSPSPASAEGASCDYIVSGGLALRTPFVKGAEGEVFAFGGKSLSIGEPDFSSGGTLASRHFRDRASFADLRLYKGSAINGIGDSYDFLDGLATVYSPTSSPFVFSLDAKREFIYAWEFVGDETACVRLTGEGMHHFYHTSSGTYAVNTNYFGSWIFDGTTNSEFNLASPKSLGGPRSVFSPEALVISGGGRVDFYANNSKITRESNRGITIRGGGCTFRVLTNKSLDIETPVVVEANSTVHKTSGGMLYFTGGVTGGTNTLLSVEGGNVVVHGARAFESYSYPVGIPLILPYVADATDEQHRFGLIAPGGIDVAGAELPVQIEGFDSDGAAQIAIATLPTAEAACALRDKVNLTTTFPERRAALKVLPSEIDGKSMATLVVDVYVPGFVVIVK